ncbi:MAG: sugar phosphate isomerase/epimerase [Acidobacteria bacterium]|nr:sugar phosphate isomerase/epimerase [Acidobacteriota bacterium]
MRAYGISTHLFHESRLCREHLVHVAAHGFETVEVFATRSHFDYRDDRAVAQLAEWLADTRLGLNSMHAPIVDAMRAGRWVGSFSNASGDEARRRAAVEETRAALQVARRIPCRFLVLHLGMPSPLDPFGKLRVDGERSRTVDYARGALSDSRRAVGQVPPSDNQPPAARRSVEEIVALAAEVGVRVAIEVIPNPLSGAASLARLIEEELNGIDAGICLDYGHAHLMGDLGEAIETISGHLWTTHVHDNGGVRDDHLVPFAGAIDWGAAMMETQKIGYDGPMMFEVADTGDPVDVLRRAVDARERLEKMLVAF